MSRSEKFCPDVPLTYRGVEVCDHVAYRWDTYEGSMWRMGVDNAADELIKAAEDVCKSLEDDGTQWFPSDWEVGMIEGKERAAEYMKDALMDYKRESK